MCGLNEAFVGGLLEGADCPHLCAQLEPEEGLCCVKVRPVSQPFSLTGPVDSAGRLAA